MSRAAAAIEALRRRNPDAVLLARAVSFAAVIDRGLLRAARLELLPGADAGSEADLWFSSVVKSRTSDGIVLDPEAAEELRQGMEPAEVEEAWRLTSDQHRPWLAPSLFFEEEIAYLSVSKDEGARGRLVERVQSVVRAMLKGDRPGLAQWASRALRMFPTDVRELRETKMLDAGTRIRLGQGLEPVAENVLPEWLPLLAPSDLKRTKLQVELRERELVLSAPAGGSVPAAAQTIDVPDTVPLVLEVSWQEESAAPVRQVTLRAGESVRLPVGSDAVRIRTIAGQEYEINEAAATSPALQSAVIDYSAELARHANVIGRDNELAELQSRTGLVLISGDPGIGKTALLCELTRRLAPAPVFVHFFRSGDYWQGSIVYAMRSLAAQIALRYHLDDSVVDLSLGEVLARLALSPRCPQRLYIVLDDINDARDQDRNVPDEPLAMMFSVLPGFVTVYASSVTGLVNAEVRRLKEEGRRIEERTRDMLLAPYDDLAGSGPPAGVHYEPPEIADRFRKAEIDALDTRARSITVERNRLLDERSVFQLQGNVDATVKLFGRADDSGQGNFARAEVLSALARTPDAVFKLSGAGWRALGAAWWPLPTLLFDDISDSPLLRREGELVELPPGLAAETLANTPLGLLSAADSELLMRLQLHRDREDVRRYYALHAPQHLLSAERLNDARDLCLDLTFMKEVIRYFEPALMRAHVLRVFEDPDHDLDTWRRRESLAFEREADAMAAAPDEIDAILQTYSPDDLLVHPSRTRDHPPYGSQLVLSAAPYDLEEIPVRRHDGAVGGVIGIGGDQRVTWTSDGRMLFWPSDPLQPPAVLQNATAITAAAQSGQNIVYGDTAGFLHFVGPDGKVIDAIPAHADAVAGVAPDVGFAASWSSDGVIRLWSFAPPDGGIQPEGEWAFHDDEIRACAFAGDYARLLVSASRDGTIRTWSIAEKRAIQVIRQEAPVTGLVVSSDGRWFAAGDEAGKLRIAAVEPATESLVPPHVLDSKHKRIAGIARSSDDRFLATWGDADNLVGSVRIWALGQQPPVLIGFAESSEPIAACAFVGTDRLLISSTDGKAQLMHIPVTVANVLATGVVIRSVLDRPQTFFTGDDRGRLLEWAKPDGRLIRDYSKAPEQIDAIAAAGKNILTVKAGGEIAFAGSTISEHVAAPRLSVRGDRAAVWSATEDRLLLADLAGSTLLRFNDDNGRTIVACALGHARGLLAIAYDSDKVYIVDEASTVRLQIPAPDVCAIAFAMDDVTLVVASKAGVINTVEGATGKLLMSSTGDGTAVVSIEVDEPRRRYATVGADRKIRIRSLDGDSAPIVLPWEVDPALGCRFAPNGELVAIGWNGGVRIWRGPETTVTSGGPTIRTGPAHRGRITGFDVGYDVVFTCSEDRTVRMWNLQTGDHEAVVYGFNAFRSISAAGDEIVAGDDAGEVWRMVRNFDNGVKWTVQAAPLDAEFALRLDEKLMGASIELAPLISEEAGLIVVISEATARTPRLVDSYSSIRRPAIAVVLDDTDPAEANWTPSLPRPLDFRRWRDPYEFAARFRELLERMDRATASPQASA